MVVVLYSTGSVRVGFCTHGYFVISDDAAWILHKLYPMLMSGLVFFYWAVAHPLWEHHFQVQKSDYWVVFSCVSATCDLFYHPHCVAKLLHCESAAEVEELRKKIAAGEFFTRPIHKCIVCKLGENKLDPDLKITFEDLEDEGILQRAWEGLIPNRILIYCLEHEIDDEIRTPIRNHIKFLDDGQNKKRQALELLLSKRKVLQKERTLASTDASRKRTLGKVQKGVDLSSITTVDDSSKNSERKLTRSNYSKKQKVGDTTRKPLNNTGSTKIGRLNYLVAALVAEELSGKVLFATGKVAVTFYAGSEVVSHFRPLSRPKPTPIGIFGSNSQPKCANYIPSVVTGPIFHKEGGRDISTVVRKLFCIFASLTPFFG
ncbi:hypothetical protein HYC85_000175 [Camellia sinensis]|uniref:Histone-lysine N-methyltransferase NSD-like PHD zinc finger domain-containing protein n=1 Tax=Camellia sinensis TaxID=4442 RepID=A0A7J7I3D6_CAMSI|nr:hypothetical protein HYC85_000175 [Camellia sinensis]